MSRIAGVQRARVYVSKFGRELGSALVVLGIAFLIASVLLFSTPTETITHERNPQSLSAEHSVTVTVDNPTETYTQGEVLQNEPLYLSSASDDATLNATVTAPEETELTITTVVEYRAIAEGDSDPFWTDERVLSEQTGTGTTTVTSTVNTTAVRERVAAVQQEFGASAAVNARVVTVVGYDTGSYSGTFETSSPLSYPSQNTYQLDPSTERVQRTTPEEVVQVDQSRTIGGTSIGFSRAIIGFLGVLSIIGGAAAVYGQPRLNTLEEEIALAKIRYDDFVTPVEGPVKCPLPDEYVGTLDELVQYAITTSNQVRECGDIGVFVVQDDETVVMYDPNREARRNGEKPRLVQGEDGRMHLLGDDDPDYVPPEEDRRSPAEVIADESDDEDDEPDESQTKADDASPDNED